MKIERIRSQWHEPQGFSMERKDTGEEYIFIQFITPAQVYIAGKIVEAPSGSCIMYDKHSYQYIGSKNESLIHDWMHICGDLDEIAQKYGFHYNTLYTVQNPTGITDIVRQIEEEYLLHPEYCEELTAMKVEELILKIMRESNSEGRISHINKDTLRRFLFFRIRLMRDYQKQWTIPQMAEIVGFSQTRFCSLYKEIFSVSPKHDLREIRMEQAKQMLLQNEYTVTYIASQCGYTNRFYFIRAFKEKTGMTPIEWAKKKLNGTVAK